MNKIRKGDEVIVTTGRDKGRRGQVLSVSPDGQKLLVEGINTVKKSVKANPNTGEQGGIIIKSMPIHRSNVMLYNPATQEGSKVSIKVMEDGRSVRIYRATGEAVDVGA